MKVWEDLYGNYLQIGKITVPIVLSEEWIATYHLKEKAPKVASVLASEGMVERDSMKKAYEYYYGGKKT